jgi:hypothetical protein
MPTTKELLADREQLEQRRLLLENKALEISNKRLSESVDLCGAWVNPLDAYRGDDGTMWGAVAGGAADGILGGYSTGIPGQPAFDHAGFNNEISLLRAQEICRYLALTSEFAICMLMNLVNYTVGTGLTITAVAKKGQTVAADKLREVQDVIDEWCYENDFDEFDQESVRRCERDGEAFVRYFNTNTGFQIRFAEPWQVKTPGGVNPTEENTIFGVRCVPNDVCTVLGYYVSGEFVPADEMQHRKVNVDRNVRRGISTLWAVRDLLDKAKRIQSAMASKIELTSKVAIIRHHSKGVGRSAVESFVQSTATANTIGPNGQQRHLKSYADGTIVDVPNGMEWTIPATPAGVNADSVAGLQSILRAIGSRSCLPEFMISSDASNANYASTLVAEGPAVKMFESKQRRQINWDLKIINRVLAAAVAAGELSQDVVDGVTIQAAGPKIVSRESLKDAQAQEILADIGAMSLQTICAQNGLDYEQEQANIAATNAKKPATDAAAAELAKQIFRKPRRLPSPGLATGGYA